MVITFDWSIERFGYGDHNIGAKDPENVVEEETTEENATVDYFVQLKKFDTVDGECQTEYIVGNPVLFFLEF